METLKANYALLCTFIKPVKDNFDARKFVTDIVELWSKFKDEMDASCIKYDMLKIQYEEKIDKLKAQYPNFDNDMFPQPSCNTDKTNYYNNKKYHDDEISRALTDVINKRNKYNRILDMSNYYIGILNNLSVIEIDDEDNIGKTCRCVSFDNKIINLKRVKNILGDDCFSMNNSNGRTFIAMINIKHTRDSFYYEYIAC